VGVICEYARRKTALANYDFEAHSALVTYGRSAGQECHIDLGSNVDQTSICPDRSREHFQFGLVVSREGCTATKHALCYMQPSKLEHIWPEAPSSVLECAANSSEVEHFIKKFGSLLLDHRMSCEQELPQASLTQIAGGVIHCAPPVYSDDTCRVVIFFSGVPRDTPPEERYDPTVQYNEGTLVGGIVICLWNLRGMDLCGRKFLLEMWLKHSLNIMNSEFYTNYSHEKVINFFNRAKDAVKGQLGHEPITDMEAVLDLSSVKQLVDDFAREPHPFD
jgi:hypothetical protein